MFYDPTSPTHRRFLKQSEIAERFGPSRKAYNEVLGYLRKHGFKLVEGSANRQTLTVRGTRAQAEQTFGVLIRDYSIGDAAFYANDRDPAFPKTLSSDVLSISGMSSLAKPEHSTADQLDLICDIHSAAEGGFFASTVLAAAVGIAPPVGIGAIVAFFIADELVDYLCFMGVDYLHHHPPNRSPYDHPAGAPDGTGQTIGLLEFDTFNPSDVRDYISLVDSAKGTIAPLGNLSAVPVNGGVSTPGAGQVEVLLDIAAAMVIAPGARVVVYHAPFSGQATSYATLFSAMINDGVTVISNSWTSCEDQVTLADVQGIEAVLQTAAASGISVFNASGDSGSTCLDGSPNTAGVPATSPSATAVGGTTLKVAAGLTYGSETWWDGTNSTPPTGQGGFGVSRFFARPAYQDGLNPAAMRSIPDVSASADPANGGVQFCQASRGGCPTGLLTGGTSLAAPIWAAFTAQLNQAQGHNLGALNPQLYPLANTDAFHNASSMGSDFAHVGLGSPNLNALNRLLSGGSVGLPDAARSQVSPLLLAAPSAIYAHFDANGVLQGVGVPADGISKNGVLVRLLDASGNTVSGKTVTLTANGGNAVVTPASGVTTVSNGAVVFEVTESHARDGDLHGDGYHRRHRVAQTATITFGVPPATSAGISANPPNVQANGSSTAVITVTLRDNLSRPTPGKLIRLSQGSGHSVITGPNPPVTDANGVITFTATNLVNETVTYRAVDVNDGDLPIPGNPQVTFSNGSGSACGQTGTPTAGTGFVLTPFATGFNAGNFFFGGVNWNGCQGAQNPAFDLAGSAFISDFKAGNLYQLGSTGGAISSSNLFATLAPTLAGPVFGKDGRLYAPLLSSGGGLGGGSVMELDPATGTLLRTVVSGLTCPSSLAVDPISGDLFFDNQCFNAGFNNANIFRIQNPASASPTVVPYVTLPASPNALMAFAPNGSLYVVSGYGSAPTVPVLRVAGTNSATPGAITDTGVRSDYSLAVGEVLSNGEAKSLIVHQGFDLKLIDIATKAETVLASGGMVAGTSGPDGCLYMTTGDTVYKLSNSGGGCTFAATSPSPSLSLALAAGSPNPVQGGAQSIVASLRNVPAPADTPVLFSVLGTNSLSKLVRADANGLATLNYTATLPGLDTIRATATVAGTMLTSNRIELNWAAGRHVTFLSLNRSPRGGPPNSPFNVVASLTDMFDANARSGANQTIGFALGSSTCTATTGPTGLASCELTPQAIGPSTLTAQFVAAGNFVGSNAAVGFNVMAAVNEQDQTPPALNLPNAMTVEATGANGAVVNFNVTATDAVDPNPTVSCTPQSGSTFALGTTQVSCTATDASGNTSEPGTFDVTVRDTTAPTIANVPANITVNATSAAGAVVTYASPSATDLVSGTRPVNCTPASGSTFPVATTPVTCTATDGAGNTATAGFSVAVQTASPPGGRTICTTLGHKGWPDIDVFQFEGKANENVTVRIAANPSGSFSGSSATLVLLGFNLLKIDASAMPNSVSAKLPKKGSYFVKVLEDFLKKNKFTGAYCVTLESSMGSSQTLRQW